MWKDPIVEKIHKIRKKHAEKFKYDIGAICDDLREKESKLARVSRLEPVKPRIIRVAELGAGYGKKGREEKS